MIINCVAYQNGRKLADIPVSDISSCIALPDCFVWVVLADSEPAELYAMQHEFGLHELAVEVPSIDSVNPGAFNEGPN